MTSQTPWSLEWTTLQNNYQRYESGALMVKLLAVIAFVCACTFPVDAVAACIALAVLWLQEGILRTWQARLGQRLLRVEGALASGSADAAPFQLHTEWEATRPDTRALLMDYALSACRPTVAFPYAVLLLAFLVVG